VDLNQLLNDLAHHGIKLSVEGEQLRIRAPSGALTPELRQRLSDNKASLLALLRQTSPRQEQHARPSLVPVPGDKHLPFPLTDIQQAYWIGRSGSMEMGNVGCQVYWELDSTRLELERLSSVWRRLIARHDMLRAIITPDGQQRILSEVPAYSLQVQDLRGQEPGVVQARLDAMRNAMSHRVYVPEQWPLFDIQAVRLGEQHTRLFVSFDMLIMDGASIQQLLGEWRQLYEAPLTELAPLELSFRDYVLAEAALKGSEAHRRSEAYWFNRLATLPLAPELPVLPLPAGQPARFVRRTTQLEAAKWERLRTRALRAGLTPSGLLCAAYAEVLGAWSSDPSFSIALTMFRRHPLHAQVNDVIGDFTSTLILAREELSDTFEERARRLQARLDQDLAHSDISGVELIRELNRTQRGMVSNGIPFVFTSLLGHRENDTFPLGWLGEVVHGISQTPQVCLDFLAWVDQRNLVLNWDALEAAFPPGLLDDMFAALGQLLHRLATEDASWREPSWRLVPVPGAQLEQRARVNATGAPVSEELLHLPFAAHARRRPEQLAVISPRATLTYGELARRAHQLGRLLREHGARPGDLVAVVMEKGWEQVAAVLGILASGAAYLPIDASLPTERLHHLLAHGQARLVLTQSWLQERLAWPETVQRFPVDDDSSWASYDSSPLEPVQGPDDLAYVIYTSGSTGLPKGVVIDHRGAMNTLRDVNQRFGVGPGDRTLALSSLNFDLSVYDIFGLLAVGGAIVLPEESRQRDPAHWSELVERERVTLWNSVPALMEMWVEHLAEHSAQVPDPLRLVLMSGDWIPVTLPERIRKSRHGGAPLELISMGGATEASIWSILHPIGQVPPEWKSIPYGRPMVNQRFHVLDEALEARPVWVPGDLYIGGIGLAKGYWRDEEKTRASFITHPRTGERLYRTGDRGRYLPDGSIEFLGRNDGQVKVGGHRIELGEIESNLTQHPGVQQAVVVAKGPPRGNRRLVAYVVPKQPEEELGPRLREFLLGRLPDYMVPALFVRMETLPLTGNGKVDRKALSTREDVLTSANAPFVEPQGELEERLAALARAVFKVDRIGAQQNFFELGGTSIHMIQLANHLREALGRAVSVTDVFRHPAIRPLAAFLEQGKNAPASLEDTKAQLEARRALFVSRPQERSRPFPLTELQQAYWLGRSGLFELGADAVVFVEVDLFNPDLERLRAATQRVIERHEMLRAIVRPDGQQQILEHVPPFPFTLEDLRGWAPDKVEAHLEPVRHRLATEATIETWPQLQVHACWLDGGILKVLIGIPCIVVDAGSFFLAARELVRFYREPDTTLEPLDISYRDLVLGMLADRESEAYRASQDYWRGRLASLPPGPELPLARPPSSVRQSRFNHRTGTLPRELWERLQKNARKAGVTTFTALGAIYAEVISRWSSRSHFTLNILYQDRPLIHPQVHEVFGNFGTTLLLEVDNRAHEPFEDRVRRLQARLWSDIEHVRVSGIQVVRELARAHGENAPATMPVVFTSTLHVDAHALDPRGALGRRVTSTIVTPHVWIDHQVSEEAGALRFNWDVVEELFPPRLIDAMFEGYRQLLVRLAEESAWRETHFPLLPAQQAAEREAANATAAPIPEELLHGRFVAQARARPSQVAVVDAARRLTYDEVFREANQVGRRLRELGARPNTVVAVVMEKGWEQVVATLGILHSGAAYLPIDPSLPTERIHYLLQNAEVELVLTQPWVDERLAWPSQVRRLRVDEETFAGVDDSPLSPVQGPEDLAYVIFTSGSTGMPKGVMISHRGAINTLIDINQRFEVGPGDRVLALSSLSFDLSVYDVFGVLAAGGTLVLPSASAARDPSSWATLMQQEQVTLWNSVPALMQLLVEHLASRPELPRPPLRCVLLSGDWIPVALPDRLRALFAGVQVVSLGGATEASIWSILYPIEKVDPAWQSIPYGRPMKNQTFHVLDEHLEPCPVWVMGELYIGGIGLARGYWRDEEKTRSRFITHPRTGERLYRTGDLGRYLPGGDIEFMGRADFQVKIQGYRIELGEIETHLEKHPSVQSAVVNAVGERRGSKRLVGYVVCRPEVESLDSTSLRDFLRQKLPEYMVPSSFIQLEALPLSSNGKVDRKALSSAEQVSAHKERAFVAPRDETELQLARLWEELLNVSPIGIKDSFFDLGGHSFAAVRLTGMIQRTFQRSLSLHTLMQGPTIEQLAQALRQSASASWSSLMRLQSEGPGAPFFCVHAVGGSAVAYRELALHLGQERPFYGLQARGVDTDEAPLTDIPEMARRYIETMREVQPRGPYHLGGWSFGGLVAFEMASQLTAAGEEVATLVLLDSQAPAPVKSGEVDDVETLFLFARDIGLPVSAEALRPLTPDARLAHVRERAVSAGLLPGNAEEPYLRRLLGVYTAHLGAARRYTPRPYGGRIHLVRAEHLLEELGAARHAGDPTWGWSSLTSEPMQLHVVPGDHFTLVRAPHVRQLAETLRRVIPSQSHLATG
jgi:yersiniabactin nonribosomal peptide synthetase